jgi:deazaflavin-dependent oxidoreductase (nitroreductase family)
MPIPRVDPTTDNAGVVKGVIARVAMTPGMQWYLRRVSPHVDPALMRRTRGRLNSIGLWPRFVLLTHTGAKSGVTRVAPLVYFTDEDRVILIASNYGDTRHPAWYHNVLAHPSVTLYGGGFEGRFVGREAVGVECDRLWALAKRWLPIYGMYDVSSGHRRIPLLVLTPNGQ